MILSYKFPVVIIMSVITINTTNYSDKFRMFMEGCLWHISISFLYIIYQRILVLNSNLIKTLFYSINFN